MASEGLDTGTLGGRGCAFVTFKDRICVVQSASNMALAESKANAAQHGSSGA